jgi:single-stranded-DNA-specific exonuclease
MENIVFSEAMAMINSLKLHLNKFIFVYSNNWHEGIIGIIAGKLKDFFNKPIFVATFDKKGRGKGSARSVYGINVADVINEAIARGIIESGGGHHLAGGFSINLENSQKFHAFLKDYITTEVENTINIDCEVPSCIDFKSLADSVFMLEPFGKGAEKPIFCMKSVRIESYKLTNNEKHMIMIISSGYSSSIRTIIFNIKSKQHLMNALKNAEFSKIDVAFSIKKNEKYGPSIIIEDVRISAG